MVFKIPISIYKVNSKFDSFNFTINDVYCSVGLVNEMDENYLSEDEKSYVANIRNYKRKIQYTSVRALAKRVLSEKLKVPPHQIIIKGGVSVFPSAICGSNTFVLSFSHKDNFVAVALSENSDVSLGVDIERIEEKDYRYFEDFLHDTECTNSTSIIRAWSVKEAILKCIGSGLSIPARDIEVMDSVFIRNRVYDMIKRCRIVDMRVLVFEYNDYVLSLSYGYRRNGGSHG